MESTILERICLSNIDLRLRMDRSHLLFPFRATDRFLASYPRSGNTWARSVVSYIMAKLNNDPEVESFNRLVKYTPDIYLGNCDQCPDPRIIKTHSHYMPHFANLPRCVYIVRDGRDIAVSYYYYRLMVDNSYNQISFSDFLVYIFLGQGDMFSPWQESVKSWVLNPRSEGHVLVVRYEDLMAHPVEEFSQLVDFYGIPCPQGLIEEAVDVCTIEKLRKREKEKPDQFKQILPSKNNEAISFFRRGKVGSYKEVFSARDLIIFDQYCADVMDMLGYDRGDVARAWKDTVTSSGDHHAASTGTDDALPACTMIVR